MTKVVWYDIYSVDVKEIDEQHKMLVDFINQGYEYLNSHSTDSEFAKTFYDRLIEHSILHFGTEEKYFTQFKYPDAPEHVVQHELIKARIVELKQKYLDSLDDDVIFDTLQLLDDWLFKHIMEYDKKYAKFFNEHGLH